MTVDNPIKSSLNLATNNGDGTRTVELEDIPTEQFRYRWRVDGELEDLNDNVAAGELVDQIEAQIIWLNPNSGAYIRQWNVGSNLELMETYSGTLPDVWPPDTNVGNGSDASNGPVMVPQAPSTSAPTSRELS